METLEGRRFVLRLDLGGVRASSASDGGDVPTTVYDSVSSFLINNSAGYKAHFNSSLFAALSQVAQEREAADMEAEEGVAAKRASPAEAQPCTEDETPSRAEA